MSVGGVLACRKRARGIESARGTVLTGTALSHAAKEKPEVRRHVLVKEFPERASQTESRVSKEAKRIYKREP